MSEQCFRRIHIRKEALKFSSAHMTVFPDGTKEALHGHNYRTKLTLEIASTAVDRLIPFKTLKKEMKQICAQWDEKVLLAERCPQFKIIKDAAGELEFTLCGKRYVVPRDEVELLPVDNIVTETLAEEFCRRLLKALDPQVLQRDVLCVEVRVEEMLGQGASFIWSRAAK